MNPPERLRQHPENRLASPVMVVDLKAAAQGLRAEPHPAISGHRQIAIARHGPVTSILFVFDADGLIKEHSAEGTVMIQVLAGRLQVLADEEVREVKAGELMAIAPGVPHSVRALAPSEMLLTVHLLPNPEADGS
jgi:quercetin dioxygenase-like cupin family protein